MGERAPLNTCVTLGPAKWLPEIGISIPDHTDGDGNSRTNVTDFADMARHGLGGYQFLSIDEAQVGDFAIWNDYAHVSIIEDIKDGRIRTIGAGGPTGVVAFQPRGGGYNGKGVFVGVVRPPYSDAQPAPAPAGESEKDRVKRVARYLNGRNLGTTTTATEDGVPGFFYWSAIQRAGRNDGLYPQNEGWLIDGIPGNKTYELERHYSSIA